MKIDIFCDVIDFWGDVAVSWRLAQALSSQYPHWQICYFCNDWRRWQNLTGYIHTDDYVGSLVLKDFVQVDYQQADVVIEMLACQLPTHYPIPQLQINLEYFTTEDWGRECHLLKSHPRNKFFFFPGISARTGGLVWGDFWQKQYLHRDRHTERKKWLAHRNLELDPTALWISSYVYKLDYQTLDIPAHAILIGPRLPGMDAHDLAENCIFIECTLDQYDELIWLCDLHLVRGEDSLSRALLSGLPFLWQAYEQEDQAHLAKVEALIGCIADPDSQAYAVLKKHFSRINEEHRVDLAEWMADQALVTRSFAQLQQQILQVGAQEVNLGALIQSYTREI